MPPRKRQRFQRLGPKNSEDLECHQCGSRPRAPMLQCNSCHNYHCYPCYRGDMEWCSHCSLLCGCTARRIAAEEVAFTQQEDVLVTANGDTFVFPTHGEEVGGRSGSEDEPTAVEQPRGQRRRRVRARDVELTEEEKEELAGGLGAVEERGSCGVCGAGARVRCRDCVGAWGVGRFCLQHAVATHGALFRRPSDRSACCLHLLEVFDEELGHYRSWQEEEDGMGPPMFELRASGDVPCTCLPSERDEVPILERLTIRRVRGFVHGLLHGAKCRCCHTVHLPSPVAYDCFPSSSRYRWYTREALEVLTGVRVHGGVGFARSRDILADVDHSFGLPPLPFDEDDLRYSLRLFRLSRRHAAASSAPPGHAAECTMAACPLSPTPSCPCCATPDGCTHASIDGNFKNIVYARPTVRQTEPALGEGSLLLPVADHTTRVATNNEQEQAQGEGCPNWTALQPRQSSQKIAVRGDMAAVCRHLFFLALMPMLCNERFNVTHLLVDHLAATHPQLHVVFYDVACKFAGFWRRQGGRTLTWAMAVWHAVVHTLSCRRRFDPRVLPFTGLTLSEGCELNWSMLNTCAPLVAAMAPGRRHEEVGLMAEVINAHRLKTLWETLESACSRALGQYTEAREVFVRCQTGLQGFGLEGDVAFLATEWLKLARGESGVEMSAEEELLDGLHDLAQARRARANADKLKGAIEDAQDHHDDLGEVFARWSADVPSRAEVGRLAARVQRLRAAEGLPEEARQWRGVEEEGLEGEGGRHGHTHARAVEGWRKKKVQRLTEELEGCRLVHGVFKAYAFSMQNMTDREQVVATRSRTVREMKSLIAALTALGADPPSLQECLRAGAGPTTEGEDGSRLPSTLPGLRARALVEWNRVCRAVEECVLLGRELASAVAWCGDGVAHLTEVAAEKMIAGEEAGVAVLARRCTELRDTAHFLALVHGAYSPLLTTVAGLEGPRTLTFYEAVGVEVPVWFHDAVSAPLQCSLALTDAEEATLFSLTSLLAQAADDRERLKRLRRLCARHGAEPPARPRSHIDHRPALFGPLWPHF